MAYALGKYSYGVCDRCGFRVRYLQMRMEWTGFKVCPECYEPKHPQLEPLPIIQDPQSLENARPQIAVSRVFVGGSNGPISGGRTVVKPDGADAPYDGKGFGLTVNRFETADEVVTHTRADGSTFTITTKSMMPLELQAPKKPTRLLSAVGNVTVSIS